MHIGGESGMIYIIEDDENIRNLVQVALNGSGYETAAFETAEEALGAFKRKGQRSCWHRGIHRHARNSG